MGSGWRSGRGPSSRYLLGEKTRRPSPGNGQRLLYSRRADRAGVSQRSLWQHGNGEICVLRLRAARGAPCLRLSITASLRYARRAPSQRSFPVPPCPSTAAPLPARLLLHFYRTVDPPFPLQPSTVHYKLCNGLL